jgi:hypothetical protein
LSTEGAVIGYGDGTIGPRCQQASHAHTRHMNVRKTRPSTTANRSNGREHLLERRGREDPWRLYMREGEREREIEEKCRWQETRGTTTEKRRLDMAIVTDEMIGGA